MCHLKHSQPRRRSFLKKDLDSLCVNCIEVSRPGVTGTYFRNSKLASKAMKSVWRNALFFLDKSEVTEAMECVWVYYDVK